MKRKMTFEMKCLAGDEPRIDVTDEFVQKNKLKIDYAVAVDLANNPTDTLLGFDRKVAAGFIAIEDGYDLFTDEYKQKVASGETEHPYTTNDLEAAQDFLDYMVFAWKKAFDERGLSASRSVAKLAAWMKILGRPDVAAILEDDSLYNPYGRPALRKACEALGVNHPDNL